MSFEKSHIHVLIICMWKACASYLLKEKIEETTKETIKKH